MGCSAAKNLTVEPLDGRSNDIANGHAEIPRKISIPKQDVPPLEGEDPQTELLETATVNNLQKGSNGMSFEIAFQDEGEDSIIKKHPPKRFQRLEEQQNNDPNEALSKLQEKLDEAEIRRQQILQQRVQSAKLRKPLRKQDSVSSEEDPVDHLKVPPDITQPAGNPYDVSYI